MQPLRFIQQDIVRIREPKAAHFYCRTAKLDFANFANRLFANQVFANQGRPRLALYECAARRLLHAGAVPNEVRWKNLLRHLKSSAARLNFVF